MRDDEFYQWSEVSVQELHLQIAEVDEDGKGSINFAEFCNMMERFKSKKTMSLADEINAM